MGVALLDLVAHEVGRRSERDMARHAPRDARVKEGDHLTLSIEDTGAGISFGGEVLFGVIEDGYLPGGARQVADDVGLELGTCTWEDPNICDKLFPFESTRLKSINESAAVTQPSRI